MLTEDFFSSVCGPPLASNTAVAKDVGIYSHTLKPSYSVTATFKKSQTPINCLAVNDSHIFAAQHEKASIHVYSRLRGNQETHIPLTERIRCLTLAGDVLVLGTAEGRLMLWETLTGRLVSTPPCHVQPVSCLAATPYHLLSGSEDSNVHVWTLPRLLQQDSADQDEPDRTLSNHRAAVTALVVGPSTNLDTNIAISASRDKTCIIWNYQTGTLLRTLLFPAAPLCMSLDPGARALCLSSDDGSVYIVDFFADRPLLGLRSTEAGSTVVPISSPFGLAPPDVGPASCLALTYDGTFLLSGHASGKILQWSLADNSLPTEVANLNAAVTNLTFIPPLSAETRTTRSETVVKPSQADRNYTITAQFESDLGNETRFASMLNTPGFPQDVLESAILSFQNPAGSGAADQELQAKNEELLEIINEQRALLKETLQRYAEAKSATARP